MLSRLPSDITAYVRKLNIDRGLFVSIHDRGGILTPYMHELVSCNIHSNPYCIYIKTNEALWQRCVELQSRVFRKCENCNANGSIRFFGMCHAGVCEYIYPVACLDDNHVKAFVSVSGMRESSVSHRAEETACEFGLDLTELHRLYMSSLTDNLPDTDEMDTLIMPLVHMLELLISEAGRLMVSPQASNSYVLYYELVRYIMRSLEYPLSAVAIAEQYNCSVSYISHLFKRFCGMSVGQYIKSLRLRRARTLLEATNLPISDIAVTVGFCDANWFSTTFSKEYGMSPSAYRKTSGRK